MNSAPRLLPQIFRRLPRSATIATTGWTCCSASEFSPAWAARIRRFCSTIRRRKPALARVRATDAASGEPAVGERFELYVDGIELANGYHELLDANELRRRQMEANAVRRADGRPGLPETNRLLAAMEAGLPPSTGVALGFDRLAMIAAGAKSIQDVLAFPTDSA